jgi:S1-C subfamily serine protease
VSHARAAGAIASLLLHAALLAAIVARQVIPADTGVDVQPARDGEEMEMRLLPAEDGDGDGPACEHSYRGIGVMVGFSGLVEEVVSGGPADHAGMRVGDRFLNDSTFLRDQYAVGRTLSLRIERDGQQLDLPVRIGKVCYEGGGSASIPHLVEHP